MSGTFNLGQILGRSASRHGDPEARKSHTDWGRSALPPPVGVALSLPCKAHVTVDASQFRSRVFPDEPVRLRTGTV